jgi:general nucleoside transport system permease protein
MVRRMLLALMAPALAIAIAIAVSSVFLLLADASPWQTFASMWEFGTRTDSLISMVNRAIPLYIAGIAVAIGFKMGLFNIGVEGQYRIATVMAAGVGAAVSLPAPLHVALILVVAVLSGMAWVSVPIVLKVTRGVSEVISTIMMNAISVGVTAWLLTNLLIDEADTSLATGTEQLPTSARFPTFNWLLEGLGIDVRPGFELRGFVVVALVIGLAYYLLVSRTRFGYELRATGVNPTAARIAGVNPNAMIAKTLLLSGGTAGLVGMSYLLGAIPYRYDTSFPANYGFTGIAVALLGRNHPVGIAIGALLFGFMDRSAQVLDLEGIPKEIVVIMQGVIVISVVIAYELVRRLRQQQQERAIAHQMPAATGAVEGAVA